MTIAVPGDAIAVSVLCAESDEEVEGKGSPRPTTRTRGRRDWTVQLLRRRDAHSRVFIARSARAFGVSYEPEIEDDLEAENVEGRRFWARVADVLKLDS